MCMAVTALGVDTILPAFDDLREALGLEPDATEITGLITFYLVGSAVGLLPAGVLADRYGRRAVMWGGLAIYAVGAIGSMLAPTLSTMLVARLVWGLGSAGPRVAALAMVRDGFAGEQMARQMSFVMAVFLLVPAAGPAVAAGILVWGTWQVVVGLSVVAAVLVAALVFGLPETLPVESRVPLATSDIVGSYRTVLTAPGIGWYLLSLTSLFGGFLGYLASSELILDQTYGLEEWFPLFFGGLSLVMLVSMIVNGRVVERVGLRRLSALMFAANIAVGGAMLTAAIVSGGDPPFWLFVALVAGVLFTQQALIPNVNSSAMVPLAAVAGTGAAVLNMVSGTVGAVVAEVVNQQFDGTITPLSLGFVISSCIAAIAWRRAVHVTDPSLETSAAAGSRP